MVAHLSAMTRPLSIICCIVSVSPALLGDVISEDDGRPGLAMRHLRTRAENETQRVSHIRDPSSMRQQHHALTSMMGRAALEALCSLAEVDGLAAPATPVSMVHARPTVGHLYRAVDEQCGERQVRSRSLIDRQEQEPQNPKS
jgi:hypothetical protein